MFGSVEEVQERFRRARYIASRRIATVVFLAERMGRPVLIEGPAGVGKTELAKVLAEATGRRLIRLQCYEGLDEGKALYEWKYAKQLLAALEPGLVESTLTMLVKYEKDLERVRGALDKVLADLG